MDIPVGELDESKYFLSPTFKFEQVCFPWYRVCYCFRLAIFLILNDKNLPEANFAAKIFLHFLFIFSSAPSS